MSSATTFNDDNLPTRRSASRLSLARLAPLLESTGGGILRYGLVGILLYLGAFKFTAAEAQAIQLFVASSPFMGWLYGVLSVQVVSNLMGVTELLVAALIALRPISPRLSAIGGLGGAVIFLTTLSFLFSMPGVWERVPGFPLPMTSLVGAFLLKDLFLLGSSVWSAGESLRAVRKS
ncbi:YkgB family protein [Hyalangium versicolor]|uniref:YkgB family protein n=1 Tax=Hyalangium versicolor TaxID=2861190 RepID=UPI001CCE13F4|nr:DUF417 family protein [Hyalangium versicolor]